MNRKKYILLLIIILLFFSVNYKHFLLLSNNSTTGTVTFSNVGYDFDRIDYTYQVGVKSFEGIYYDELDDISISSQYNVIYSRSFPSISKIDIPEIGKVYFNDFFLYYHDRRFRLHNDLKINEIGILKSIKKVA